jgi:hypothetical protein
MPAGDGALLTLPVLHWGDDAADAGASFVSVAEHAHGRSVVRPMEASVVTEASVASDSSDLVVYMSDDRPGRLVVASAASPPVLHAPPLAKNDCELRRQRIVQRNLRPAALAALRGWLDGSDQGVSGQLGALLDPADAAGHAARAALRDTPGGRVPTFAETVGDAVRFLRRRASFVRSASAADRAQEDAALASTPRSTLRDLSITTAARSRFAPAAQQRLSLAMSVDISHSTVSSRASLEGLMQGRAAERGRRTSTSGRGTSGSGGRSTSGLLSVAQRSASGSRRVTTNGGRSGSGSRSPSANPLLLSASELSAPEPRSLPSSPHGLPSPHRAPWFR